jgi:hypothetical protein
MGGKMEWPNALARRSVMSLAVCGALAWTASAAALDFRDFENPPNSARPRVWWHWLNGNITKDGIRKDIEWMSRSGLGGLQNFDAEMMTPQVVARRLPYMDAGWKDAFKYAAQLAEQNKLEFGIAASPGWSETGGPWVAPKDGMKKLVWSETVVDGGKPARLKLRAVPRTSGPFQDLFVLPDIMGQRPDSTKLAQFGADIAVYAYPVDAPPPAAANGPRGEKDLDAASSPRWAKATSSRSRRPRRSNRSLSRWIIRRRRPSDPPRSFVRAPPPFSKERPTGRPWKRARMAKPGAR